MQQPYVPLPQRIAGGMHKVSVPHGQKNNRPWRTEDINIGIASRQKIPDIVEWNDTELYPGGLSIITQLCTNWLSGHPNKKKPEIAEWNDTELYPGGLSIITQLCTHCQWRLATKN